MNPASEKNGHDAPPSVAGAVRGFVSSAARYLRAVHGLAGYELRESGWQALALGLMSVAFVVCCVVAYVFLLAGVTFAIARLFGGAWGFTLIALFAFHAVLAAALLFAIRKVAGRPVFPGTRQMIRRELDRLS